MSRTSSALKSLHPEGNLERLCNELERYDRLLKDSEILAILKEIESISDELAPYKNFSSSSYQRNRILKSEYVDLLVLCWKPGQRTPIHDHSGSWCGALVLEGECTEIVFSESGLGLLVPTKTQQLNVGELSVAQDSDIHMLANLASGNINLVTVHCYSPSLAKMTTYHSSRTFLADYEEIAHKAATSGCYHVAR